MNVTIIGGGLSGLLSGKILAENGFDVKVRESQPVCGGLAASFSVKGYKIPIFYHHIFSHDKTTLDVVKEVGLRDLIKKRIKMGLCFGSKKYSISYSAAPFWDFLSFSDKIKFGKLSLHTKIKKDWSDLEDLNAEQWLSRTVGKNVTQKVFGNLMREKYGLPLSQISASELAERLGEGEATGVFYYPKKGLDEMINRLVKKIEKCGGEVRTSAAVRKITIRNNKVEKIAYEQKGKKKQENADILINTAPIPVLLQAANGLPSAYKKKLSKIKYCKNICVDIGYGERLSDFYWLNCFDSSFGGIIEHTNLADIYPFKFAWLFKYAPSQQLWNMKDEKIAHAFINNAKKLFPNLDVQWYRVFRSAYASPLYDINYAKHMPSYETPVQNLFLSGIALTYPKIRTMNTAFASGIKTAEIIMNRYA